MEFGSVKMGGAQEAEVEDKERWKLKEERLKLRKRSGGGNGGDETGGKERKGRWSREDKS